MLRQLILMLILLVDFGISSKCQIQVLGLFSHLGCFVDSEDRLLPHFYNGNANVMENNRCTLYCKGQGFKYAGTESANWCLCGDTVFHNGSENVDDNDCNTYCDGDSTQICGGEWRLSVYATGFHPWNNRKAIYTEIAKDSKLTTQTRKVVTMTNPDVLGCAMHCLASKTCKAFEVYMETGECSVLYDFESLCEGFQYAIGYSIFMLM